MSRSRPHTQSELAKGLEGWYARRQAHVKLRGGNALALWESDEIFMALALALWPVDMECAADPHYQGQSARMRLRLRWEGFRATSDVQRRLEAMLATADFVRSELKLRAPDPHDAEDPRTMPPQENP